MRIHSIETMGTLDGPGIRMVVFTQGCPLRCIYCHNPDTWDFKGGYDLTAEEIIKKAIRFKEYFKNNSGGITISGGEPLAQKAELIKVLKLAKAAGIHTTIDTSGFGDGNYDELLKYVELVILDIKHIDEKNYQKITGVGIQNYLKFKAAVIKHNTPLWIKHVVVEGYTDSKDHIERLKEEINSFNPDQVQKVELLPYHTLGTFKYRDLGLKYPLEGMPDFCQNKLTQLKEYL